MANSTANCPEDRYGSHQRRFERAPATSALPPIPDVLLSRSKRRSGPEADSCTAKSQGERNPSGTSALPQACRGRAADPTSGELADRNKKGAPSHRDFSGMSIHGALSRPRKSRRSANRLHHACCGCVSSVWAWIGGSGSACRCAHCLLSRSCSPCIGRAARGWQCGCRRWPSTYRRCLPLFAA
jgi:hypothetical protein